jgi:uncharacterized membrane protein
MVAWLKRHLIDFKAFRSSLWFLPSVMVTAALLLAIGLVKLDASLDIDFNEAGPRIFGASSDGARKVLATIAGSMITVAGVIFSVTIVTLSLAANQYTPRILRNFTKDRGNQIVLGFFMGLFTYCLTVLRTIRGGEEGFIPAFSVLAAIIFAVIGIFLFIYFIHHSTLTIQTGEILSAITAETIQAIDLLFPDELGEDAAEHQDRPPLPPSPGEPGWFWIHSSRSGYIQAVQQDSLLGWARQHVAVVKMEKGVGDFVVEKSRLLSVWCDQEPDEERVRELNQMYTINPHRSIEQDPAFGVRQIVDIALKALSPGVNDSTTASTCVDHLTRVLHRMIHRATPSCYRHADGQLRVIACGDSFQSLLDLALHEIRQNLRGNVALLLRILQRLAELGETKASAERKLALWKHATWFRQDADSTVSSLHDRELLDHAFRQLAERVGRAGEFVPLAPRFASA